jgi:hypothetical protein
MFRGYHIVKYRLVKPMKKRGEEKRRRRRKDVGEVSTSPWTVPV